MYWSLVVIIILIAFLTYAAFSIRSGIFIKSITRSPTGKPLFSFDDGPHPTYTLQVLEILERFQIKAIFFCIGQNAEKYPVIVKKIIESGHELGNHTFHHAVRSTYAGWSNYLYEIELTTDILQQISGKRVRYFRPPFGITNPEIAKAIKASGLESMAWNIRTFDTVVRNPVRIAKKIARHWSDQSIILMHDTSPSGVEALEYFLNNFYKR